MNDLERQLASLLTQAPGEPPNDIDPDAILARAPRRRRYLAPALAAAAVLAIAVPIAVAISRGSGTPTATSTAIGSGSPTPPATVSDPEGDAIARITAALAAAPLPAGSTEVAHSIAGLDTPFSMSTSPNQVRRTSWWTAPGDVSAAIAYMKEHPPTGMHLQGWASGGSDDRQEVDFADNPSDPASYPIEIEYYMAPYQGGIALRVDAVTTWAPSRPAWSVVPGDAASADLTVVRDSLNPDRPELGGAPTVQRTLTGAALTQLADALNALPARAPEGIHSCPAMLVNARDLAVFHTPAGDIRIVRNGGGCAFNATITAAAGAGEVYVNGADFTNALLTALGLPKNYGYPAH